MHCNPSIEEIEARGSESKITLGYTISLRPAWDTGDSSSEVKKERKEEKERKKEGNPVLKRSIFFLSLTGGW